MMAGTVLETWTKSFYEPEDNYAAALAALRQRDQSRGLAGGSAELIVAPGDSIGEPKAADNRILLLTGDHGGMGLERNGTLVKACPGARMTRQVVVGNNAEFDGIDFVSLDGGNSARSFLVDITSTTATVLFRDCRFIKASQHLTQFVQVANGARVHFIGCQWLPSGMPAGTVVTHVGPAANVGVIGCSNRTGQAFPATVTIVFLTA